ncbi:MAG: DUF1572 family protein [Cyclobacteriaceae bacterium]
MNPTSTFLESSLKLFKFYKRLGENAMQQVPDEKLSWQYNEDSNSIATIVKHLSGNMHSRWTDFLTTDGEKEWRERDAEFETDIPSREAILKRWEEGWKVLFDAIQPLAEDDFQKTVYIRNEGFTVIEAISRQLAHYACHVGQIIYLAKMYSQEPWQSLSSPRGKSASYNRTKINSPSPNVPSSHKFQNKK